MQYLGTTILDCTHVTYMLLLPSSSIAFQQCQEHSIKLCLPTRRRISRTRNKISLLALIPQYDGKGTATPLVPCTPVVTKTNNSALPEIAAVKI